MGLRNSIAYLAVCAAFAGCSAPRVIQDSQRDSVVVIVKDSLILRDSIVLVPVPQEGSTAVLPQTDTSFLETSVAKSTAFVNEKGQICHTLTNKDALLPVSITIPTKVHTELKEKAMVWKQVETMEVEKELSRWQRFIQALGYGLLLACVLWLANKVRKIVA